MVSGAVWECCRLVWCAIMMFNATCYMFDHLYENHFVFFNIKYVNVVGFNIKQLNYEEIECFYNLML